jgi:hypothetical protein
VTDENIALADAHRCVALAFIDECSQSHEPESQSSDYFRPVDAKLENIAEGAVIYVPIYSHI